MLLNSFDQFRLSARSSRLRPPVAGSVVCSLVLNLVSPASFAEQPAPRLQVLDENGLVKTRPISDPSEIATLPSIDGATVQLMAAYYRKTLADELFLAGKRSEARTAYSRVAEILDANYQFFVASPRAAYSMMRADVTYRVALLDSGADFWGGGAMLLPTTPAIHLKRMNSLIGELRTVNDFIGRALATSGDAKVVAAQVRNETVRAIADVRATLPMTDGRTAVEDAVRSKVDASTDKKKAIEARIRDAVIERNQFMQEADKAAASAASAINETIVSALGVDPQLLRAAQTGDVRSLLLTAVADGNLIDRSTILADLEETFKGAAELHKQVKVVTEKVSEIQKMKETVDGYMTNLSQLRNLVESPTRERLVALGLKVMDSNINLPPQLVALRDSVVNNTPVNAALTAIVGNELSFVPELVAIQNAIAVHANWNEDKLLKDVTEQFLSASSLGQEQSIATFQDALDSFEYAAIVGNSDLKALTAKTILALWPYHLFLSFPPSLRQHLQTRMGQAPSPLTASIAARELAQLPIDVVADNVVVQLGGQPVAIGPLRDLIWAVRNREPDVREADAKSAFSAFFTTSTKISPMMREFALARLPGADLQELGRNLIRHSAAGSALASAIRTRLSTTAKEQIARVTVAAQVGSILQQAVALDVLAGPGQNPVSDATDMKALLTDAATRQIAKAALDAALPGLGTVALAAGNYLNAVSAFDKAMARVYSLEREVASLSQSAIQLTAELNEATRALGLLRAQAERDAIYRRAAFDQVSALANVEEVALRQVSDQTLRVQRRAPRVFFYAEMLRQEFDAFERSLARWLPFQAGPRDSVRQLIAARPNYLRLALDTDIHLFSWLDRDDERRRGSADATAEHWERIVALAATICESARCPPSNGGDTNYYSTEPFGLQAMLTPAEWERFSSWKAGPSARYAARFVIAPNTQKLGIDGLTNVRLVHAGAIARAANGEVLNIPLRLKSFGSGIVRRDWGFEFETLPEGEDALKSVSNEDFTQQSLSTSLESGRSLAGYGVYGSWEIVFPASPLVSSIASVEIRMGFFYQGFARPVSMGLATQQIQFSEGLLSRPMRVDVVPVVALPNEFAECVRVWQRPVSPADDKTGRCTRMSDSMGLRALATSLSNQNGPARIAVVPVAP